MQKGQVRCRELHSKRPKGDARWGMFAQTSGQSITWGHRSRSSPKLWRATTNQCFSSQDMSFLLLLQCPLYLHRGWAFAEPGLAWIFNGINNHRLWCRSGLPGSLSVTGSQNCPLSPCPALLTWNQVSTAPTLMDQLSSAHFMRVFSTAQPQVSDVARQEDSKQSCERETGKNRTWEGGIMVWLVPYLWANHLACTGRVINIWVSYLSTLLKDTTPQNEVEWRISRCPAQDIFG